MSSQVWESMTVTERRDGRQGRGEGWREREVTQRETWSLWLGMGKGGNREMGIKK